MEPDTAARIAELLSRTNRRLRRQVRRELAPDGITPGQLRSLWILSRGPLRIGDLADRLDIVPRSATSVIDDLEAGGYARRVPDPDDRRAILVEITEAGEGVLHRLLESRRAGVAELLDRLSKSEQEELVRLLELLC